MNQLTLFEAPLIEFRCTVCDYTVERTNRMIEGCCCPLCVFGTLTAELDLSPADVLARQVIACLRGGRLRPIETVKVGVFL